MQKVEVKPRTGNSFITIFDEFPYKDSDFVSIIGYKNNFIVHYNWCRKLFKLKPILQEL